MLSADHDEQIEVAVEASEQKAQLHSSQMESAVISLLEQNINDTQGWLSDMELIEEYEGISVELQGM